MENKREILKVVDLQKKFHKLEVLKVPAAAASPPSSAA